MLKKFFCSIVVLSMLCSLAFVPTSAVGVNEVPDNTQEQIEETLSVVFDYLNNQSPLSLGHLENRIYNIPVGEETVVVSVRNEQVQTGRGANYEEYPIQKNTSYTYTLTINKIHSGSGSIVCKVYYNVGEIFTGFTDVYRLLVIDATATVTPPNFYSIRSSGTAINHNWDNTPIGEVATVANFSSSILSDFSYMVEIDLASLEGSIIRVTYKYGSFNN